MLHSQIHISVIISSLTSSSLLSIQIVASFNGKVSGLGSVLRECMVTKGKIKMGVAENPLSHVSLLSPTASACWGANGKYAQKLLTDLFANYTSALRPVEDTNTILNVTLQITLSQIIDMVLKYQVL